MSKTMTIEFEAEKLIELAFAAVTPGMEQQLFSEYFPQVGPIIGEYGGSPIASFTVSESHSSLGSPSLSAFFYWPSVDGYDDFHQDERFLTIKHLRDEALDLFSNGHFYQIETTTQVTFEEDREYALVVMGNEDQVVAESAVAVFKPMKKSQSGSAYLMLWGNKALSTDHMQNKSADVYKMVVNFPKK